MRRFHLFEFADQPWLPTVWRDLMTDFEGFFVHHSRPYEAVADRLAAAVKSAGAPRIVDLCSGGGVSLWTALRTLSDSGGGPGAGLLTDKYPNAASLSRVVQLSGGRLTVSEDTVDASAVPEDLVGFRTLFTSFHHFEPDEARRILRDAMDRRQGIGVFEYTERSPRWLFPMLINALFVLFWSPLVSPFRWSRFLWTYLLPVIPLLLWWDGMVSCLRAYTPDELREMVQPLQDEHYTWEVGRESVAGPMRVTYLIGYPK